MKKLIIFLIIIAVFSTIVYGAITNSITGKKPTRYWWTGDPRSDTGWLFLKEVEALLAATAGTATASKAVILDANGRINTLTFGTNLKILEGGSSPQYMTTIQGSDQSGDLTLKLPATAGTNGQSMVTDGAGQLSFSSVSTTFTGGTITSNTTLDDNDANSPDLVLVDGTNETATFRKEDAGYLTLTTDATDGLNVLVGNLKVGDGTPTITLNGERAYVEKTIEADGYVLSPYYKLDNGTQIHSATINVDSVTVKAMNGTPVTLVAAPGSDSFIEVVSIWLILEYGSSAFIESDDNMVVEYTTSGIDITGAIESTGLINATADTMAVYYPIANPAVAAANVLDNAVRIKNTGDGEFAGNSQDDNYLRIKVNYRIHTAGL